MTATDVLQYLALEAHEGTRATEVCLVAVHCQTSLTFVVDHQHLEPVTPTLQFQQTGPCLWLQIHSHQLLKTLCSVTVTKQHYYQRHLTVCLSISTHTHTHTHTDTHTHTHTRTHAIVMKKFPGEPKFAGCPLISLLFCSCILSGSAQTKIFHILHYVSIPAVCLVPPTFIVMQHDPININNSPSSAFFFSSFNVNTHFHLIEPPNFTLRGYSGGKDQCSIQDYMFGLSCRSLLVF